jgi:hypothetical protein
MMHGTVDRYTYSQVIRTESPHWCSIIVYQTEDWDDLVPELVNIVTHEPINFALYTGLQFDLWIRPSAQNSTVIDHLTSPSGGIHIDLVKPGRISLHRDRTVVDDYPIGSWEQWLSMTWTDSTYGVTTSLIWRGPFHVYAGPYTPPVVVENSMGAGAGDMLGAGSGDTIGVD